AEMTRAAEWTGVTEESFNRVFVGSQRMIAASLSAYLIAQFVDIAIFHALRRATHQRLLWLRASGSTVISQLVDTITINLVAWVGILPLADIVRVMVSSYVLKVLIAVGLTPLIYAGHALIERTMSASAEAAAAAGPVPEETANEPPRSW
ncbi:MAG TPA: queuosine precursor transporter, partial [Polyangiaceae bacterium]|nr:queuosine precursor transporter [Polyangiaceae bacterium]